MTISQTTICVPASKTSAGCPTDTVKKAKKKKWGGQEMPLVAVVIAAIVGGLHVLCA